MNPDDMTPAERAAATEAADRREPVRMVTPDGSTVAVPAHRVKERLAAGYVYAEGQED